MFRKRIFTKMFALAVLAVCLNPVAVHAQDRSITTRHSVTDPDCNIELEATVAYNMGQRYEKILITTPNYIIGRNVNNQDLLYFNTPIDGEEINASVTFLNRRAAAPGFEKYIISYLSISTQDPSLYLEPPKFYWKDIVLVFKSDMTVDDWINLDITQYQGLDQLGVILLQNYFAIDHTYDQTPRVGETIESEYFVP